MKDKMQFLPIVLGSDENSYGNCRLLREAYGVRPLVLCSRRLLPTQSSHTSDYEMIENFDSDDVFAKELLRVLRREHEKYEKIVVIPCSDYYVALLSRNYDKFEGLIANRFISFDLLEKLEKKHSFYELCNSYSFPCPPSYITDSEHCLDALEKVDFGFPLVVKPENSNASDYLNCHFEGKKKVFIFSCADEYRKVMSNLAKSGYSGKLILQKFIPGGDDTSYVVNAYCDSNGKVTMMAMGQVILEEYAPKTLGNYAGIICRYNEELLNSVKNFLETIGYVGFANFDFKYDAQSGKTYVFEINPRLGRSSFFAYSGGVNFMRALVDDCVFNIGRELEIASNEALWINVPMGVINKYVSNTELKKQIRKLKSKGISRTLLSRDDLSPARLFKVTKYYLMHYRNYKRYFFKK